MHRARPVQISPYLAGNLGGPLVESKWIKRSALMLAAWLTVCFPAWSHHTPTHWLWSASAAVAAAGFSAQVPQLIASFAALSAAVSVDLLLTPAESILSYCLSPVSGTNLLAQWLTHARWFPVSTAAMVALAVLSAPRRSVTAPTSTAFKISLVGVMQLMMQAGPEAIRLLASLTQTPLTANGLVCGMLIGMLGYHWLVARLVEL